MNILVIGNGFDLAHGLPTRYSDFLRIFKHGNPTNKLSSAIENARSNPTYSGIYKDIFEKHPELVKTVNQARIIDLENKLENNVWAKYYAGCNAEINGWVDFEKEMFPVFDLLKTVFDIHEGSYKSRANMETELEISLSNELLFNRALLLNRYFKMVNRQNKIVAIKSPYCDSNYGIFKSKILKNLKEELDDFIEAFRNYLTEYVCKIDVIKNAVISGITADAVISFNYTKTENFYDNLKGNEKFYIHGEYDKENSMVMGVDKLTDDADNEFIYFVKYFQRIRKWCDQRYKELLNRSYEEFDLTFYGHSLDETDSDILVPFIKGAGKVRVYYYDEYDYEKKVINLINLFKRDYVEEKMYERKIEFVPAQ